MASFYEGDADEAGMEVEGGGAAAPAPAPSEPASGGGAGGRINLVSDDQDEDSDSEQQAFYAGGSTNSGNMVSGEQPGARLSNLVFPDPGSKEEEGGECWRLLQSFQRSRSGASGSFRDRRELQQRDEGILWRRVQTWQ